MAAPRSVGPELVQVMAGAREGGAELFFERLAAAFVENGVRQRVIVRGFPERSAYLRRAGVDVTELPFGGPLDLWTRFRLRERLRHWRPRVVLSWMNRGAAAVPRGPWRHAARLGGFYNLRYYRSADWLVCLTPRILDYVVREGWPRDRAVYLPNFADPIPAATPDRSAFDIAADVPVVVAYGRLHTNKAFDTLLRAIALVPNAVLVLAGDGPERAALAALARELGIDGRVRFVGWIRAPQSLLPMATLFVCPSRHEPHGNIILEAMMSGRPIVSTASDGADHLLEHGKTALICPVDDVPAMAARITDVLADREAASAMAAAAEAAVMPYTKPAVVAAYRAFFERIAD